MSMKISELTLDTTPATSDELVVQRGGTSNFRTSVANLLATSHNHAATEITSGTLPVARGGTGTTTSTGTGNTVLSTSPTFVTPVLGTPSSGTLTSCTGLPIGAGTTGTLAETRGGTNQTTFTTGDILYASASNTLSKLAVGTNGQVLTLAAGIPSWAAAAAGGEYTAVKSTADTTVNNTTTMVNITGMTSAVSANTRYEGYIALTVKSTTAADIRLGWTVPSGTTGSTGNLGLDRTDVTITNVGGPNTGNDVSVVYRPFAIDVDTTAGNLAVQFAQLAATAVDTTVYKNSILFIREVET